jgi:hypothetical protein
MGIDDRTRDEHRILDFVLTTPGATHDEIGDGVGLSSAAVSKLIGPRAGRLHRVLVISDERPRRISIRRELGCVISIDVGSRGLRARIADLRCNALAAQVQSPAFDVTRDPSRALDEAAKLTKALLAAAPEPERVAGLARGSRRSSPPTPTSARSRSWRSPLATCDPPPSAPIR